ncbi:MAG: trigger factor [Clostridiales bacterium]|nr:trigger factor [Clostridiales bacterium]
MSTVEVLGNNKVKLTFSVDSQRFEEGMNHSYQKNKGYLTVQGFRKGKAPRKMLEMVYGKEVFYEDAINFVLPASYEAAVKETEIKVVSRPEIDVETIDENGVVFTAEVYVKPEVKVEGYKGLKFIPEDVTVTDEDVNAVVDSERNKQSRIVETDKNAELGNIVNIDFKGYVDDVPFEGGEDKGFDLELGSHSFIDTFEDQLVGSAAGQDVVVNVKFPENYGASELAGKDAKFEVKVNKVKVRELPDLDDEFVSDTTEFENVEEYLTDVRAKLVMSRKLDAENRKKENLIEQLAGIVEGDIPECMYENETDKMFENFANSLRYRGMPVENYLQMINQTEDAVKESFRPRAEVQVKSRLALEAIAAAEGFEADENEVEAEINRIAGESGIEKAKLEEIMAADERESLKDDIKVQKALDLVVNEAVAEEAAAAAETEAVEE